MEIEDSLQTQESIDPMTRSDSNSTSASANLAHLTALSSLASATAQASSAQTSDTPVNRTQPMPVHEGSLAAMSGGMDGVMPTCQNCDTSRTPLWRRDEFGSVLCNACGLFLKLHGRARPSSLRTDVIKSRNRVKTLRPDLALKKKQQAQGFALFTDPNGTDSAAAQAAEAMRRTSQKNMNGNDGVESPVSRTGTPSMYNNSLPSFIVDDPYSSSFNGTSTDGRAGSPINGERGPDGPLTHEQLIAHNSSLKTRVSELEVINELFRGRLSQLEQQEAAARRGQEVAGEEQSQLRSQLENSQESESQLRAQLDESHRRENILKRRLDEMELELTDARNTGENGTERPVKRSRTEDEAPRKDEDGTSGADATD